MDGQPRPARVGRTGKGSTMADEQPGKPKRLTELSHCAG